MSPAETVRASRPAAGRAWWAALLMLAAVVSTPILVGVLGVEIQAGLGIGDAALGACVTAFWASTGLSAVAGGRLIDRAGWRRAALAGLGVTLLCQLGVAASGSVAALVACLVVAGAGYGVVSPASNLVVVREIPERLRGTALGAKQSATPVVALLAGLAVPLVALTIGWRWAFLLAAVLTVAAAVASLPPRSRVAPRRPSPRPRVSSPATAGEAPRAVTPSPTAAEQPPGIAGAVDALPPDGDVPPRRAMPGPVRVSLARVSVITALATFAIGALTTFGVSTLTRTGLDVSTAGLVVSAASVAALGVRLGAGWLADRRESDGFLPAALMLAACALGTLAMASGRTAITVAGVVVAFCGAWGWPALLLMGVLAAHPARPGVAGARYQLGTAFGAAAGPLLFAAVSDVAGLPAGWGAVTACTAASAALVLLTSAKRVGETG